MRSRPSPSSCCAPPAPSRPRTTRSVSAWLLSGVGMDDPLIDRMMAPRLFEAEGVGRALRDDVLTRIWADTIHYLAFSGRLSRDWLLDACLRRFLRGGSAQDLGFFLRVHEMIDPTPQEIAARRRDYLRLLPAAHPPVAEVALAVDLRRRADRRRRRGRGDRRPRRPRRGRPGPRRSRLARGAGTGRSRHRRRARQGARRRVRAPSDKVQERAAHIALRHADAFAPAAEVIAEAVPLLPAELRAQVAARFGEGSEPPRPPTVHAPPLPAVGRRPGGTRGFTLDVPDHRLTDPVRANGPLPPTLTWWPSRWWAAAWRARAADSRCRRARRLGAAEPLRPGMRPPPRSGSPPRPDRPLPGFRKGG